MRACLAITAWLILAVAGAGMAWAAQNPPQLDAEPSAVQQTAPSPAPETVISGPRESAEPDLTRRDLEHLNEVTRLRIKVLEIQIESIGDRLSDAIKILIAFIVFIGAAAGITGYFSARREARSTVEKWINDEGGKVLDRLTEEAEKEIEEIIVQSKREIGNLVKQATQQKERLDHILERANLQIEEPDEQEITPSEKAEVDLAAREAELKTKEETTYRDWEVRGLSAYFAGKYEDAVLAFHHASQASDVTPEKKAKALFNKGMALSEAGKLDEAIAAYDEVARRFGDADETALLEQVAMALNFRCFARVCLAKKARNSGENEREVKALLSQAVNDAEAALEITPDNPIALGNKGYALFLLSREEDAEPVLRRALELGGKELRDGLLEDAAIHPLPEDEAFKELISRLWSEVSSNGNNDST